MRVRTQTRRATRVVVNDSSGLLTQAPGAPTTVQTSTEVPNGPPVRRFDQLLDVQEGTPSDGDVPVYDQATDTYVVEPLRIDGGTF